VKVFEFDRFCGVGYQHDQTPTNNASLKTRRVCRSVIVVFNQHQPFQPNQDVLEGLADPDVWEGLVLSLSRPNQDVLEGLADPDVWEGLMASLSRPNQDVLEGSANPDVWEGLLSPSNILAQLGCPRRVCQPGFLGGRARFGN